MKTLKLFGLFVFASLIFASSAEAEDFNAGPIWNQADAQRKCPGVCAAHTRTWNGQWRTTVPGKMSVCGCVRPTPPPVVTHNGNDFNAGPIWNQADAQRKCPGVCTAHRRTWTGHWRTTVPGKMSVCNCTVPVVAVDINAGPIWNQADAQRKCPGVCTANRRTWTGHWRTTVPNKMSVCNCR